MALVFLLHTLQFLFFALEIMVNLEKVHWCEENTEVGPVGGQVPEVIQVIAAIAAAVNCAIEGRKLGSTITSITQFFSQHTNGTMTYMSYSEIASAQLVHQLAYSCL